MSIARTTFDNVLVILVLIFIGIICYKVKLIDKETNNKLNSILLSLVVPIVIIMSYQRELSEELLSGLGISFILATITHLFSIAISYLLFRKKKRIILKGDKGMKTEIVDNPDYQIERFTAIYSNASFMGIPLINGIFGSEGVFYATAYITMWNIFAWTHGVILMENTNKKLDLQAVVKKLISPTTIAILIGLLLFLFQIKLPKTIYTAFDYISSINTPFAMIIAGVTIGQTNLIDVFRKWRIYGIAFVRLLFIPIVLLIVYSLFPIKDMVLLTSIVLAACPSATMVILFSIRYKQNSIYAAEIFAITTILSAITLPLVITIAEKII